MTNLAQIEASALAIAAAEDRKRGPYHAEIIPRETPCWHIVRTAPGKENKAADWLADRGIGVALPKFCKGARMGSQHQVVDLSDKLMFPGRVFVFVWDVLAHWRRIMACPGVQRIETNGNAKPVVVQDAQMDRILKLQYELAIPRPKRRKRYASSEDRISITSADYLHVDGHKRNRY